MLAVYLELPEFKLNHILVGRLNKDGWEKLCVGLNLKADNALNKQDLTAIPRLKPTNLVKGVYLFSISGKSHEPCVQINETANHEVLLTDAGLLGIAEFSSPHHVAVAAFNTVKDTKKTQDFKVYS